MIEAPFKACYTCTKCCEVNEKDSFSDVRIWW